MKECCKKGDEKPSSKLKTGAARIVWGVVILIVMSVALIQIFNL
jgi:hypothetical protein